jgi:hypothetical protein
MAADAIIVLDTLHCFRESDGSGHSEPYMWPALLWVDELTLHTPPGVGVVAPALGNARVLIKSGIKAGQTADIPRSVSTLRVRLDKPDQTPLFLVIALWENDDTPTAALQAGYTEFVTALPAEVGAQLLPLKQARDAHDDEALKAIIAIIKANVTSRVRSAIENALAGPQKALIFLGLLDMDDIIDSNFQAFDGAAPATIAMTFRSGSTDLYEIDGRLDVRPVLIDRCQSEVNAVKSAKAAVDEIDQQIDELKDERDKAPGKDKQFFQSQIDELNNVDRPIALVALATAQQRLAACRSRLPPLGGNGTVTLPT